VGLGVRLGEAAGGVAAGGGEADAGNALIAGRGSAASTSAASDGSDAYSLSTFRQYGVELNLSGRAPEVLAQQRLTPAVDVWSLACVFYFVLTGAGSPFAGRTPDEADARIRAGRFELSALMGVRGPPRAALEARHLLASMLAPAPEERPSAAAVLRHPLFWSAADALAAAKALHDAGTDADAALLSAAAAGLVRTGAAGGSAAERGALLAAACCDLQGWQARVDGALLARLLSYAPAGYDDTFAGLLRFARNAFEHPPAGAELAPLVTALAEAGGAPPALRRPRSVAQRRTLLAEYLLALFPALALACYECLGDAVPLASTPARQVGKRASSTGRNKKGASVGGADTLVSLS
jgi:hypothetical protein